MSHQTATIEDTVYFWFAANDTSGSGGDGASPLFDVREGGAAAGAAPLLSGTPTLLSHGDYPAGCHEIAVAATTGNGFAAGDVFSVFCTLAIDSQNPSGLVGSCKLTPLATAAALATAQADLDTITGAAGALLDSTATSAQLVDDVLDEVNTGAAHNVTNSLGKQLRAVANRIAFEGTVNDASASTTVFIIDSGASAVDDFYNDQPIIFTDGALSGQTRVISDYTGASRTVTLDEVLTSAPANGVGILIGADHVHTVGSITADMDANSTQLAAIVLDTGTNIPALLPAALVGGRIDADVGAISTSSTAADNLEASTTGIVPTTVNDAAASTTAFIITSSEATDDHFNGRIITFIDGALVGQATDITDYDGGTKTVTVTALTEAPGNGDAFVIT